jgi:Family of unknown function (DUF5686)/CarboxypepD_reg-like domain
MLLSPLKIMHRYVTGITLLLFPLFIYAQEKTIISGKVYDAITKEPLPFVNLLLNNTTVGTTTDIDGAYHIETNAVSDSLQASYIGYKLATKSILKNRIQIINFFLEPESQNLNEVIVKPGENPAWRIMRQMVMHKPDNEPNKLGAYQFEAYNKLEFDINNIPKKYEKKRLLKPVKFIFNYVDSTNIKEKPYLPAFITESVSDIYYRNNPSVKKEVIKATKLSGFKNPSLSRFTGDMYQDMDIYKNSSILFAQDFISPLTNNWNAYYRYYLIDSSYINGHKCYQIQFKPRHISEFAFYGNMWISDTTFALVRIEMNVASDANLDYVQDFSIVEEYLYVEDKCWMLSKNKLIVDFGLTKKGLGIYGRKTTLYNNFIINKPLDDKFYNPLKNVVIEDSANNRSAKYWDSIRTEPLSKDEKSVYKMIDTLQTLPLYHHALNTVALIATGYKTLGDFEIGPITDFYSHNTVEGDRFRFGGRTSNNFSKWYELSGYLAYGLLDQKMKYDLEYKAFITKDPWQQIDVSYNDDVKILGRSDRLFDEDNILTSLLSRVPISNLTQIKETKITYDRDIFQGLNFKLSFDNRVFSPTSNQTYLALNSSGEYTAKPVIYDPEVQLNLNLSFDEKFVIYSVSRSSLGTKYPTLLIRYTKGLQGIFNGDYNYQKLVAGITYVLHINPLGKTRLHVESGKIWGSVPYLLMFLPPGNETYVYDQSSYNLMNYYEFTNDQYLAFTAEHHFEGLFLNKIPLLRKLKWREVVTYKWLAGSVNSANEQTVIFPANMYTLNSKPYSEAGVGIENIFKIIRVDALWRLSYLSHPNVSPFAVMGSLEFNF